MSGYETIVAIFKRVTICLLRASFMENVPVPLGFVTVPSPVKGTDSCRDADLFSL